MVQFAAPESIRIPDADMIVANAASATLVTTAGETETLGRGTLAHRLDGPPVLTCHARALARRAGKDWVRALDVLELFAFVHPAQWCLPTPRGLAQILGLAVPQGSEAEALALRDIAARLLADLATRGREASDPVAIAFLMGRAGWPWAPFVLAALGKPDGPDHVAAERALKVWRQLPEWRGEAPPPPPGSKPVTVEEARERLVQLRGEAAEDRQEQDAYTSAVAHGFAPRNRADGPVSVVAEAGTGVGKTLGYLAPATVWAEKNAAPVWISTYTRNLQNQIDRELDRLYPIAEDKAAHVVVRKGRENYLCLLNFEEAARLLPTQPGYATALGLMARWIAATRDGDLTGGDLPGWLVDLIGRGRSLGLADRRGECIYSACDHYQRCFIERSVRRARRARIVVANHALVLIQAALGTVDDPVLPGRVVFDEGHHLFDAADSTFAGHLTAREGAELRRWLVGADTGRRSRARGLRRRVQDLVAGDADADADLDEIDRAARALPAEGWQTRLREATAPPAEGLDLPDPGDGLRTAERFLALVRTQVYARATGRDGPYDLEIAPDDPVPGLLEAARALKQALTRLKTPMQRLARRLHKRLDDEAGELDTNTVMRIDAVTRGLERRAQAEIQGWIAMLAALDGEPTPDVVDWFGVERLDGRDVDIGYYRHHLDPTLPLAAALARHVQGMVVTSATLTDGTEDEAENWRVAEARTGTIHFPEPAYRVRVASPFDYARQTRVLVVRDVRKDDLDQVAAAYRALFMASGGGALGLFTAISRLRAVHKRIAEPMEAAGLPLLAQHVDGMDTGTLIDIFRGVEDACLLGTDAVRDGVDVPGRALRLIVFDRVPWPRPSLLQQARAEFFGKKRYTDMLTRLRLKQAFGRLVRRADDHGVFVLLDPMMPSRLAGAFPEGVAIERIGLAEAVAITREFLQPDARAAE